MRSRINREKSTAVDDSHFEKRSAGKGNLLTATDSAVRLTKEARLHPD